MTRSRSHTRALKLRLEQGVSLYSAAGDSHADYKSLCRAARAAGIPGMHDHCTACGGRDHRAVRGACSPSYLAALDVLDRGVGNSAAARAHGIDPRGVIQAVRRLRAARLRAEVGR